MAKRKAPANNAIAHENGKPRVVIYARVSTDDASQALSCDTQIARCEDYCRAMGYDVVARIKDEGVSAKSMDRPGWRKVEEMLRSGIADLVLSTALDRMTRTVEGFLRFCREVINPHGKCFATLQENFDTSSAAGRLLFHVLLVLAQFQREQTAEKVSGARRTRGAQGMMTTTPPFGAMPGPVRGIPVIDPERWPCLERIFELAAQGKSITSILSEVESSGVRTRKGAVLGVSTITRILCNRFYLGEVPCNGDWVKAQHECSIDPAIWKAAQLKHSVRPGRAPKDYVYLLDGMLCTSHYRVVQPEKQSGQCCPLHTRYVRNPQGRLYFMYVRADKLRKHGGVKVEAADKQAADLPPYIRADQLDQKVVHWLTDEANQAQLHETLRAALKDVLDRRGKVDKQRDALEKQIQTAEAKHERLKHRAVELVLGGKQSLLAAVNEELERSEEAVTELKTRQADLGAAQRRLEEAAADANQASDHIALIKQAWEQGKREELRDLLRTLIKQIDIRVDCMTVRLYALPKISVYDIEPEAPPPGIEPGSTA